LRNQARHHGEAAAALKLQKEVNPYIQTCLACSKQPEQCLFTVHSNAIFHHLIADWNLVLVGGSLLVDCRNLSVNVKISQTPWVKKVERLRRLVCFLQVIDLGTA